MSPLEVVAVGFAIAYLLLAIRQNIWCWAAALLSTGLYVAVMYRVALYMESALQFFYIGMAVYGWYNWRAGKTAAGLLPVTTWPASRHALAIAVILGLSWVSGVLLTRFSAAALPYLDSFTTWGAIVTTWMVARKVLENWLYWFVIDGVSVILYISRELYLTAALFVLYLVLIIIGYWTWRKDMQAKAHDPEGISAQDSRI